MSSQRMRLDSESMDYDSFVHFMSLVYSLRVHCEGRISSLDMLRVSERAEAHAAAVRWILQS